MKLKKETVISWKHRAKDNKNKNTINIQKLIINSTH